MSVSTAPDTATTGQSGAARIFIGSVAEGFERVAHLRPAALPGGDAAAQYPVQAAAGFLAQMDGPPESERGAILIFPTAIETRWRSFARASERSRRLPWGGSSMPPPRSLGFTRGGELRRPGRDVAGATARERADPSAYRVPIRGHELDFRPLLEAIVTIALRGEIQAEIARAFQRGVAQGVCDASLPSARTIIARHRCSIRRRFPEWAAPRRRQTDLERQRLQDLDQSRRAAERRWHQPRPSRAGGVSGRPAQPAEALPCTNYRSP